MELNWIKFDISDPKACSDKITQLEGDRITTKDWIWSKQGVIDIKLPYEYHNENMIYRIWKSCVHIPMET